MGKEKPAGKSEKKKLRHAPLGKQIQDDQVLDPSQRKQRLKQRIKARNDEEDEETKITPLSAKATKAILKQAKKQREELSDEDAYDSTLLILWELLMVAVAVMYKRRRSLLFPVPVHQTPTRNGKVNIQKTKITTSVHNFVSNW